MAAEWYHVSNGERIGPISKLELENLIKSNIINDNTYVWSKGYDNWVQLKDVNEFNSSTITNVLNDDLLSIPKIEYSWEELVGHEKIITIKIGLDRDSEEVEYGPYSLNELKILYKDNRINAKSLLYLPGSNDWAFLAEIPIYTKITGGVYLDIEDQSRRENSRKPFVARMLFHDNEKVFEGTCRDISIGGMQILIADFPCQINDEIMMNVHPDNSNYAFVAKGIIVRVLALNQGFSLRFVDLSQEAENAILKYISHN